MERPKIHRKNLAMDGTAQRKQFPAFTRLTLALVISLVANVSAYGQLKQLRWKFQPGDALQVTFQQNTQMTSDVSGTGITTIAKMGMSSRWDVRAIETNGVYDIQQTIERVTMEMIVPGGHNLVYDTASTEAPQGMAKTLAASVDPLVGVDFMHKMSPRGEIVDIGLSEQSKARLANNPGAVHVQQIFTRDGLESLLHHAATVLPEAAISPGYSWNGTSEIKNPAGNMVMDMVYVYKGTEQVDGRPLERIDVSVNVRFGEEHSALGLKVGITKQQNQGTLYFDAAKGRFARTQLSQKMTLETKIGDQKHVQHLESGLEMAFQPAPPRTGRSQQATAVSPIPPGDATFAQ